MQWSLSPFFAPRKSTKRSSARLSVEELEPRWMPSTGDVLSYHVDPSSTGVNQNETVLTPTNVKPSTFGQLFSTPVDGLVQAQTLTVSGVNITVGSSPGPHNVVFVATQNDSLYAIDTTTGAVLWQDSLLNSVYAGTVTPVPAADVGSTDIAPVIGITSTPVIDPTTNTIYVEAKTKEVANDGAHYIHQLYAIDLGSGSYTLSPVVIADSNGDSYVSGPTVKGKGINSTSGVVYFDALRQLQRPALTLVNGTIYLGFGSHGDVAPYHGWLLGYDAATLTQNAVFCTTPNGTQGAIWQSGGKIAADSQGNLYVSVGNGTFENKLKTPGGFPSLNDYGESFLKLAVDLSSTPTHQNGNGWGLKVIDYFTPHNFAQLNKSDLDVGSGGPLLLPPSAGSTSHRNLLVAAGKNGQIWVIDINNMGHFNKTSDAIVQEAPAGTVGKNFGTPAYFNNTLFFSGWGVPAMAFSMRNAVLSGPTTTSTETFGFRGSVPSISAFGKTNGIVWDLDTGTNTLRAYKAQKGYSLEIYNSDMSQSRDGLTSAVVKFSTPTISNGKVFVGTSSALVVFGSL